MTADESLESAYIAACAALERGETTPARREFERLTVHCPRFAPAWDGLGRCRDAEGDLAGAGVCYRRAMQLDRGNWRSPFNWGVALHRAGDLRDACGWLRRAARLAPLERCVLHRLGICHFDSGDYERALACYRKALEQRERDVSDAELYVLIGNAEGERGEFAAAEKAYEKAGLFAPDDPALFYNWASLAARHGDRAGADRLAARAAALDPRSIRCALLRVDLAMESGDHRTANDRIAGLSKLPGAERLAQSLRAELARRTGDPERARKLALETLVMDGPPSDQAVDGALATLRRLRGHEARCTGFRLVVEARPGTQAYYRPYVVLAEDEARAREYAGELQDSLDSCAWSVSEVETFDHDGEALAGVYHLLLPRVLFPLDVHPSSDGSTRRQP